MSNEDIPDMEAENVADQPPKRYSRTPYYLFLAIALLAGFIVSLYSRLDAVEELAIANSELTIKVSKIQRTIIAEQDLIMEMIAPTTTTTIYDPCSVAPGSKPEQPDRGVSEPSAPPTSEPLGGCD